MIQFITLMIKVAVGGLVLFNTGSACVSKIEERFYNEETKKQNAEYTKKIPVSVEKKVEHVKRTPTPVEQALAKKALEKNKEDKKKEPGKVKLATPKPEDYIQIQTVDTVNKDFINSMLSKHHYSPAIKIRPKKDSV